MESIVPGMGSDLRNNHTNADSPIASHCPLAHSPCLANNNSSRSPMDPLFWPFNTSKAFVCVAWLFYLCQWTTSLANSSGLWIFLRLLTMIPGGKALIPSEFTAISQPVVGMYEGQCSFSLPPPPATERYLSVPASHSHLQTCIHSFV